MSREPRPDEGPRRNKGPSLHLRDKNEIISPARAFFVRCLALLCACSLSIGSHYASYTLGPLKSRLARELGTSNTEFSLLISAFSLNHRLGTTLASIYATGAVFLGQALLLLGETQGNVRLMVFGLFVYGLGVGPLAVVQESIIVRFFNSHGLGVSNGPGTSALSFITNLVYMSASHWLVRRSGTIMEASEVQDEARRRGVHNTSEVLALEKVAKKRRIKLKDIPLLGDVFWVYIGLNVLCGTVWAPFTHLAANILEKRYDLSEDQASTQASYLLAGSIILYPASGYLVDRLKHPQTTIRMLMVSSLLTMLCYAWLVAPPQWTRSPLPGVFSFAIGVGFSPLLLVVIVPTIVPLKYVSTTLGVHKALEQTGSTMVQTLAGIWLDNPQPISEPPKREDAIGIHYLICAFLFFNVLQFISLVGLAHLDKRRRGRDQHPYCPEELIVTPLPDPASAELSPEQISLLSQSALVSDPAAWDPVHHVCRRSEKRRGRIYACLSALLICFAWILFLSTAWLRLRSREDRDVEPRRWW
ncbi:major facilitator superfamily domain-containing protein [Melanogaster broomeanus]|nr:major facilitator superfamily domain-containing protein [Melanogaster broomeanus]